MVYGCILFWKGDVKTGSEGREKKSEGRRWDKHGEKGEVNRLLSEFCPQSRFGVRQGLFERLCGDFPASFEWITQHDEREKRELAADRAAAVHGLC